VLERFADLLRDVEPLRLTGRVREAAGLVVQCEGLALPVGAVCQIRATHNGAVRCEVVGFRHDVTLLMPLDGLHGVRRGDEVVCLSTSSRVPAGPGLLGRAIDSTGRPIDGGPAIPADRWVPLHAEAPPPMERARILEPLATGVRAIDALHTCGKGQRVGLFSGSGVGKSTLLGMCARHTSADVIVVSLVGERGREVRDFVERDLGPEGLKRSVVVVETSDRSPLLRVRAPFTATAVAEYFRDQGAHVLLLMDSLTRMAHAQREVALSAGEMPATKGYPPSVFTLMPRLVERAGASAKGSITGIYSVLVEADDMNDPVADAARSVLDGHLWLSRDLAIRGHYPAVDPLESVSRVMADVVPPSHVESARRVKALLAVYKDAEDLIHVGAYVKGSSPEIDDAVRAHDAILRFLAQGTAERADLEETRRGLAAVAGAGGA
jgi:flagellum-specific ATP synthase